MPSWAACPQYYQLALDVGWPESQMRTVMYVMHRESGCQPGARSSSHCGGRNYAMGLMQLCAWMPVYQEVQPDLNLAKAYELWQTQGWCPWVLRGDPVTGVPAATDGC